MTDAEIIMPENGLIIPEELDAGYELLELLSERPGVRTVLVRRKSDGKRCAAKLFSGAKRELGRREADTLGKLDHPNIPKLVEYCEDGDVCAVIREYAEGKPLDRYAAERVMSEPAIIETGIKICRVLEYLHGLPEPVIHRDIKPQNIIVDDRGEVRLIDFGISRVHNGLSPVDTVFAGTVAYAPPEQYGFRQTDRRADIYSLGMVLQYMLTGSVDTASDKCGVEGSRLGGVIRKCTSFAPERRFGSVRELRKSLVRLCRRPTPPALIASLLAVCFVFGGVLGGLVGTALERGRKTETAPGGAPRTMPVTPLSTMLGLNEMTEEELLGITGVYIYGDTVFDSLYTKDPADPSGEKTELNSYVSGHPYVMTFESGPIEISDGGIDDISCLKYLKNLRQLVITRNRIWDISPLEGLTQLEFVDLSSNPITDVSALGSLTSLRRLYLGTCSIGDISPVYGLASLEALYVSDNAIAGIEGIERLTDLKEIDVGSNGLVDVSRLGALNGLERIFIGNNNITDLSFIRSHDRNRLMWLEIGRNPITDTSPLDSELLFDNSRGIRVSAGELGKVDLSFLKNINAFEELRLEGTDCSQLYRYAAGKQIMWLIVNDAGLADISWLETVTGTWALDISGNPSITDLSPLTGMSRLQKVTVSEDMRPLAEEIAGDVSFSFVFV